MVSSAVADIEPASAPHHHDQWDGASISGGGDVTNPEIVPELGSQYPFTRHRLKRSKVGPSLVPITVLEALGWHLPISITITATVVISVAITGLWEMVKASEPILGAIQE